MDRLPMLHGQEQGEDEQCRVGEAGRAGQIHAPLDEHSVEDQVARREMQDGKGHDGFASVDQTCDHRKARAREERQLKVDRDVDDLYRVQTREFCEDEVHDPECAWVDHPRVGVREQVVIDAAVL